MTGILIFIVFVLTIFTMGAYCIVAPWWLHRAGRAYMALFGSLSILTGFFMVEQLAGQQPEPVQSCFIGLVAAAIAWNAYTIVSKQIRAWRNEHPRETPDAP